MSETIERVGVVGCGLMGSGIAEVCSRAGLDVMVREVSEAAAESGRARLVKSLDRGLSAGKLTEADRDAAIARLGFTTDLRDLSDCHLVVEAVVEDEAMKVAMLTAPMNTGRRSALRARAAIQVERVGVGVFGR